MPSSPPASAPILRLHHALSALGAIVCLAACAERNAPRRPAVEHVDAAAAHEREASLEGWQAETFVLPPGFAPDLPTGTESLRFAPGWRDPAAEGFWSYAFVMWIDEPPPDAARIDDLLEKYYNGLMTAFAAGAGKDLRDTPARVDVVSTGPSRYEARMRLIDAFATFEPIDLRVLVETTVETDGRAILRFQVSPQPQEHPIWRSLNAAIADILSRDAAAPADATPPGMDVSTQFAEHYHQLVGRWRAGGRDFGPFTENERETIALYFFNSDYGGNGLPSYFACHDFTMLDLTLRGLKTIGAHRLAAVVREYAEMLRNHGVDPEEHDIYEFINGCPADVQAAFDARQSEAADLYDDFYSRWERHFAQRQAGSQHAPE